MHDYTTFSLETRAENVLISDGRHNGKIQVTLDGIEIGDIRGIVKALANSGELNVTEFKRCITQYVDCYTYAERLWMVFWSKSRFEKAKSELKQLSDLELIQEVNTYMAGDENKDLSFLTACRTELNRRMIDYSAINNWTSITDWKKVSFYTINGRKFIQPVNQGPNISLN